MSTTTKTIAELQAMPTARLTALFTELHGKEPRVRNTAWLRRELAWRIQERALGGLSERAKARLDELVAHVNLPLGDAEPPRRARPEPRREAGTPVAGTVLRRRWRDQDIQVQVADDHFIWNGVPYRSLSAVAKAITGTTWSGALFFNLRRRSAAP